MGFGSAPSPAPVPTLPPAAQPATIADPSVAASGASARARAVGAAGAGFDGTVGTSPQGLAAAPPTAGVTLLGGSK